MSIKKAAPRLNTQLPADALYAVASVSGLSGDLDLRTLGSGYPRHAPQRTILLGGSSALAVVLETETGADITITVPINAVVELNIPINKLIKSGSGAVQTVHMWWAGAGGIV